MEYLTVKDWSSKQHYKDRTPPWIKLDTDTFQDYEFGRLQDASKLLAICIWTLASRDKDVKRGQVPHDLNYIKNQCNLGDLVQQEHLNELIKQGFVIVASDVLADCKQSAIPEREREAEGEGYNKEAYSKEAEATQKASYKMFDPKTYDWDKNIGDDLGSFGEIVKLTKNQNIAITGGVTYKQWIEKGYTQEDIIKGIQSVLDNGNGDKARSLSYFQPAVKEAYDDRMYLVGLKEKYGDIR